VLLIFVKSADSKIVAQGTGFLVEGGKIITNKHVIEGGTPLIDLGGVRIPATVESTDDLNDLAVLTVAAEITAEPLVLADAVPPPGSNIYAIGNPQGLEKSISAGILSAVRTVGKRELIQITTPVSHGSSGGPVFDSSGKVIGVTVSSIEEGQNLNFAVPALAVIELLRGHPLLSTDFSDLLEVAQSTVEKRATLTISDDAGSPYQKNEDEIRFAFSIAIEHAGKGDVQTLLRICDEFSDELKFSYPADADIAVLAAERVIRLAPGPTTSLAVARALNRKAMSLQVTGDELTTEQKSLFERSERAARQAILQAKQPSAAMYYWLGDTLAMRESLEGADSALRRALELNRATPDAALQADILRDLVNVAGWLKRPADADKWFSSLVQTGQAGWWDWRDRASRLDAAERFAEAGESWRKAAELNPEPATQWCDAEHSFLLASGKDDSLLFAARKCIALGLGTAGELSEAHGAIATVLNSRGVYDEALSHATKAAALDPTYAGAYNQQAVALSGLHRNLEAINAAKQAIQLSDGKWGIMHFNLGYAYFQTENWQLAQQSFEKAAELMPDSDDSAYNLALCLQHLSLNLDAAHWFEEALRRNPKRMDKQDILDLISALRKR
jgi:tetratricopeptide (TPR) repeat protein